jgi:predicted CXXCH cytochrome family protein
MHRRTQGHRSAIRPLSTCLLAIGVSQAAALGQFAPRQPDVPIPNRTCANECHKDILGHKVMHGPVQSDCAACHIQTGNAKDHTFAFVVPREELCIRCHALPHESSTHAPVKEGKCLECHDPHGSEHPRALKADPRKELCLACHKQDYTKSGFVHGPVAVGACIVCHKPHSSSQAKLLVQEPRSLCLTCHAEVQTTPSQGLHIHGALEQGCTGCHDPHASNHKFQLRQSAPGLCMSCHKERFDQLTAGAKVVHGAIAAEGGCSVCHEPHSSRLASLQRGPEPGTCLACHDKTIKTKSGPPISNMAALLKSNPDWHGPIREGACTACHDPHAGDHFRLLEEPYPQQFYAPFNVDTFKLCFKCHIPDLVLKPTGSGLTRFRNGEKNLHWLHVNQEKGRTCRACHEVHASRRPAHIREAVPFGTSGWLLDINFEQTADGGSCSPGCHTVRKYGRTNPAPPPAPTGASP